MPWKVLYASKMTEHVNNESPHTEDATVYPLLKLYIGRGAASPKVVECLCAFLAFILLREFERGSQVDGLLKIVDDGRLQK